jgi:solute carrier family 35 protein E3
MTGLHFLFGGVALKFMAVFFDFFTPKSIGLGQSILVGASGVGSIALMNFSLQTNSVGTYQLMKLAVIPVVMVIQYFVYATSSTWRVKASLALLLFGVGISTVTDLSLNAKGVVFGILSVLATAQFNIWQGTKQAEHSVTSVQLMYSVSYPQAALCFILASYFDVAAAEESLFSHAFVAEELLLLFASCVLAMGVNLSSMGLIGKTSAVTYQVRPCGEIATAIATAFATPLSCCTAVLALLTLSLITACACACARF